MNITHGQIIASSCLLFIRHTHVFGACWHSKCALSVCLPMHVTQKFSRWISVYSRKNKNTNGNTAAVDEKIIYLFLTRHRTRSFVCSFIVIIIIFFFFCCASGRWKFCQVRPFYIYANTLSNGICFVCIWQTLHYGWVMMRIYMWVCMWPAGCWYSCCLGWAIWATVCVARE